MKQLYYAIQNIIRGRGANLIKTLSLSLGLVVSVLLFSQIAFELSYERCYPQMERLAMAQIRVTGPQGMDMDKTVPAPLANALMEDLAGSIQSATTIFPRCNDRIYKDNELMKANFHGIYADTLYFSTFGIDVVKGDPHWLATPGATFVSESFAHEVFGGEDPVGRKLSLDKVEELTVRGVYRDVPRNTFLPHDFVISNRDGDHIVWDGTWNRNDMYFCILRLKSVADYEVVNRRIQRIVEKHIKTEHDNYRYDYGILPLSDYHTSDPDTRQRLLILGVLGFAIFFVSVMNYVLISIANMSRHAKRVGVHKCNGADDSNILVMFIGETAIIILASICISLFLILNFKELIEDLLSVKLASLFTWETLWVPGLTVVLLLLMAGLLPGRLYARIPVTQVFRRYTDGKKGWKRSLLFVQFAGVAFILGLLMVCFVQYNYVINKNLGFQPHGLACTGNDLDPEVTLSVRDAIGRLPMVESVSLSSMLVMGEYATRGLMDNSGKRIATLNINKCEKNFPQVIGATIVEGKALEKEGDILVNEELVKLMKWTDGAIGKKLEGLDGSIIGVIKDIRNTTFFRRQPPIALVADSKRLHIYNVRLKEPYDKNLRELNRFMEQTYSQYALEFHSMDDVLGEVYEDVYRFRNSVCIVSLFILLIVLMGLIGYVSDETQRRSKEIAIRKVNGAEVSHILFLLIKEIIGMALPAVILGVVAADYISGLWLQQFKDTPHFGWLPFVGTALVVMLVIIQCVVIRAWRIAAENPVKSIKSE